VSTDQTFHDMMAAEVAIEANKLLDQQLANMLAWRKELQGRGETADLMALVRQLRREASRDNKKIQPMLDAFGAAMWRLMEGEGKL